ncbi:MAG: NAD-dependent dihydropyrimidine dehydrogenase subunit PreA [Clostridia bacterium]|nr:NAD-dependent dihydropyrimidine dehydrogenase subunit PreA [Clostridia bacterium]
MGYEIKIFRENMIGCALCKDAPCSASCGKIDCAKLLRSIWFDNEDTAAAALPAQNPCAECDAPCERACLRQGKVEIKRLMTRLYDEVKPETEEVHITNEDRLKCDICGVPLENPFLLSSSVVGSTYEMCARAFEAGWAGVCFKTISTMEIHEASPRYSAIKGSDGSIIGFKNIEQLSDHSLIENMEIFRRLKQNYPTKVIIASIMGQNEEEWETLARTCQENGADVIELNFSCPNMAAHGMGSDIGQDNALVERYTAAARRGCTIPLLVKPTPNVAFMSEAAEAAKRSGADGFAAINTIKSITNINPHTFVSAPSVHGMSAVGGYSGNAVKPIALRFIAELAQNPELSGMHISGMGGVETWKDALEFILLGSDSIQVTTAIMQYGYRIVDDLKDGLNRYLHEKGFKSVKDIRGLALDSVSASTDVLERDTVIFPKFHADKCIGCGRCAISCSDGGHQAITMNENRKPVLNGKNCVGCHLCLLVCPQDATGTARQRIQR